MEPTLVFGGGPSFFAVAGDNVVWFDAGDGGGYPAKGRVVVHRIGGSDLVVAEGRRVKAFAATSSTVVWLESKSVFAVPVEGGAPRKILAQTEFLSQARTGRGLVIANRDQLYAFDENCTERRQLIDLPAEQKGIPRWKTRAIARLGMSFYLTANRAHAFWSAAGAAAAPSDHQDDTKDVIFSVSLEGGGLATIALAERERGEHFGRITATDDALYFAWHRSDRAGATIEAGIRALDLGSRTVRDLARFRSNLTSSICVHEGDLYWCDRSADREKRDRLVRLRAGASSFEKLAEGAHSGLAIVGDDAYFVTRRGLEWLPISER